MQIPGAEHRFLTIQGVQLHYVTAGEGRPLVLLHGMGASVVTWRDNIEPLARRFAVYALDLPAHGDSDALLADYGYQALTRLVVGFLQALNLEGATLIGNSAGGLLGFLVAEEAPQRVGGVVLVSPAGLSRGLPVFLRLAAVPGLGELLWSRAVPRDRALLRAIFYDARFAEDGLAAELTRTRNRPGVKRAVLRSLRAGVNLAGLRPEMVILPRLRDQALPILLIWGAQDRILPVAHAYEAQRAVPNLAVHVLDRCGHWPHMEQAQTFNTLVTHFVEAQVPVLQEETP